MKINRKINRIELKNYKAFYGEHKIELPNGENLLVYGENGSGKSSLYKALRIFFTDTLLINSQFETDFKNSENIFIDQAETGKGFIKLNFQNKKIKEPSDTDEINEDEITYTPLEYSISNKTNHEKFLKDTYNLKSFLDYKILQKLNNSPKFNEIKKDEEGIEFELENIDLFNIMIYYLLEYSKNPKTEEIIFEQWNTLNINKTKNKNSKEYKSITQNLQDFNDAIYLLLKDIQDLANEFLVKYFKHNINVTLKPELIYLDDREFKNCHIFPKVSFFKVTDLEKYDTFLNEARLSALAISIFFAGILKTPQKDIECKILVLDDIFIGLDTSNRIPLLKILNDDFKDFQIVMTTYDRYWFNVAKDWFNVKQKDNWKCFEMYVNENQYFDIPIIYETESNLASAYRYFKDSYHPDYPAAANFLRKASEELISSFLPIEELKKEEGETKKVMLNELVELAISFLTKLNKPATLLYDLQRFVKTLMNPLSHFEIDTPVYRQDIKEVIEILESLNGFFKSIHKKKLLPRKSKIKLIYQTLDKGNCYFEFEIEDDLYMSENKLSNVKIEKFEIWADFDTSKKSRNEKYKSIQDFYTKSLGFLKEKFNLNIIEPTEYWDIVEYELDNSYYFIKLLFTT